MMENVVKNTAPVRLELANGASEGHEYLASDGTFWHDGWFLHRKGQISGPYLAKEIFLAPKLMEQSKEILLSRKGFTGWYEFDLLRTAYLQAIGLPKPQARMPAARAPERSLAYQHMILRGRLRLGALHHPGFESFLLLPFSLGLLWPLWYLRTENEVLFHIDSPAWMGKSSFEWSSLIPLWHFVKIYRLARSILRMEVQNRYVSTSPILATALAIFPPLAMYYLQKKVNAHWLLHVRHQASVMPIL